MLKYIRYFFATEFGAGLERQLQYIPRTLLLSVFVILSFMYISDHKSNMRVVLKSLIKEPWLVLFLVYVSYLLVSTIFARSITYPLLFILDHFVYINDAEWNAEIAQNIFLFVPFSFFYLKAFDTRVPFRSSIITTLVTTLFIELFQLFFWLGSFQPSDIINNLLGGVLGYGIWRVSEVVREHFMSI